MSKYSMNKFKRVLITSIHKRDTRIEIFEENECKLQVNKYDKKGCGGISEKVGVDIFQVKPYFDIDAQIDKEKYLMKLLSMILKLILKKYVMLKSIKVRDNQENMTEK
jgi:hypothetical protein